MKFKLAMAIVVLILCTILTQSTSKNEGVSWNEEKKRWQVEFDFHGKRSKYYFDNEFDAIKTRNRVLKKMRILSQDPESCEIPNQKEKEKTSKYKGVYWYKENKKWIVKFDLKGQLPKYGGCFNDELDAAKRVNELCEELEIPEKNPGIGIPNQKWKAKEKMSSQYKGVTWHKRDGRWCAWLRSKNGKNKYSGNFIDELDAAKRVNQLCEEFGIPEKNPGIGKMQHQQCKPKGKTSQYKGVYWNQDCRKWHVGFRSKDGKMKFGGGFNNELDAAKRVNQLCVELEIPEKNHGIGKMPYRQWQPKKKNSEYKGLSWSKNRRKWYVRLYLKGNHLKYGGMFDDELDAAKKVNQLCEELGIPLKNPGINKTLNKNIDDQTISSKGANSVCGSEVEKNNDTKAEKRKRIKNFIIGDKSLFKQYYFHENLLK